ncbi:prepilin-type N-terminal cleavage/methylation domain-containing protein [Phycisphaerales bacterium AB-hyl4]|uniref:Prepilin-type N-terminal cleavage/methylation domain-containing protein n=1 Tax=Natronomicrosphaera hydrolytica TaxID=3242702 RepID=A0ABV4U9Z7_9BACT
MNQTMPRGGFTLIELLIVISIIALLIALLMPTLGAARQQARAIQCLSGQRQIGLMFAGYIQDGDGWYPHAAVATPGWASLISTWTSTLDTWNGAPANQAGTFHNPFFRCPSDDNPTWLIYTHSYRVNQAFMWQVFNNAPASIRRERTVNDVEILKPASKIAVAEASGQYTGDHFAIPSWRATQPMQVGGIDKRHRDSANYLYFDGHAATSRDVPALRYWSRSD